MKKLALLLAAMIGLAGQASAQQYGEELTLGSISGWGWSKKTIVVSDQEIPQLPAAVNLPGQYGEISVTEKFDAKDIKSFKFTLAEPTEEGKIQISIRNQAQTSSYQNQYIHLGAGITEYEGTIDLEQLGEDTQVAAFAFMNDGNQDAVTFTLNSFVFVKTDGTEWVPTWKGSGWPTGSLTPLTEVEGSVSKDVYEFTNQYGEIGVDFGEVQEIEADKPHTFTLVSSEPIPAGQFQWKVYNEDGSNSYLGWNIEDNIVTLDMPANYTGISIQHIVSTTSTLPQDIKLYRKIVGGPIARETLPIKVGGSAVMEDPNPGEEMGENGLPIGVNLPGSWGGYGLWKEPFSAAEYPAFKVVLREKPTDVQFFYRTHVPDAEGGNVEQTVYVPWETNEEKDIEVSEDGTTLTGWFDIDALGSSDVEAIALQNTGGSAVKVVVMQVYLMNEDEEWIETPGLGSSISIWNTGSTFPVSGSYDENGNLYDAYVTFKATNDYVGAYGAAVEEGTYHVVTFYTEEPMPEGLTAAAVKTSLDWNTWQWIYDPVAYEVEKKADNAVAVKLLTDYSPYEFFGSSFGGLQLMYTGDEEALPLKIRVTKIVREIYEATPADYVYSVVGDIAARETFMTKGEEGIWTLVLADQQIKSLKDYTYRVRANKSDNLFTTDDLIWTPDKAGVYTFTITFDSNDGSVKLEAVRTDDCTWGVSFANNGNWEKVMVRVMSGDKEIANEEATFSRHSSSQDVDLYTWSLKSEDVPTTIIFSDGNGTTTGELEYEDGKQYDYLTTTGIANVKAEAKDAVIYDMQGRRVSQPGKGLYIINGKKVVLK